MKFPTLYQKAQTGKITQWTIWTEGNLIIKEHGEMGGRMQTTTPVACYGKNIGKANETTPEQQAEMEAKSQWQKKLDNKYSETIETADAGTKMLPMLANHLNDRKGKEQYPAYLQRKYDGVRCLAFWEGNRIKLLSRGNKEYTVPVHINEAVARILPEGKVFDGEIYKHGLTLQEINRRVKKHRGKETDELEYHVYDVFDPKDLDIPWAQRLKHLDYFEERELDDSIIKIVETRLVTSREQVDQYEKEFVAEGYEGAIFRPFNAPYVYGKKTNNILKVKSFQDEEFEIVNFEEGKGKYEGCVIWVCKTKEGKEFNVVPKGTYEDKKYWFDNAMSFIGKMLTVKFFNYTEEGIPFLPVGKSIRLEEDMDEKEAA